jgi:hypothetical protein
MGPMIAQLVLLWFCATAVVFGDDKSNEATAMMKCAACKLTVKLFATEAYTHIAGKGGHHKMVDDNIAVLEKVCKNEAFSNFSPIWQATCQDLAVNNGPDFQQIYTNKLFDQEKLKNSVECIEMAKSICVEKANICPSSSFNYVQTTPTPKKKRERECQACNIIAQEIDVLKSTGLLEKKWVGKKKGNTVLIDGLKDFLQHGTFCNDLTYYYQPGTWLGEVCDEMMDDDQIEDVLDAVKDGTLCTKLFGCRPIEKEL